MSKNILTAGLYSGSSVLLKNSPPCGLLKNRPPNSVWSLMYSFGARNTKSPGVIFNPKAALVKGNSLDLPRASNCGNALSAGGENTG